MPSITTSGIVGVYDRFKTPYYKVEIGFDKSSLTELPLQLKRLLEKVEIVETIMPCHNAFVITLVFREGSREPFPHNNSSDTSSVYGGGQNDLSNANAMLTDLEFDKTSGLLRTTSQVAAEIQSGVTTALQTATGGTNTTFAGKRASRNRAYLFQENNYVRVTWGYLETPLIKRTVVTQIRLVQTDFPENDHPVTTITCLPLANYLDQVTMTKGKGFFNSTSLFGKEESTVTSIVPYSSSDVYNEFKKAGFNVVISKDFPASLLDKDHAFVWMGGKSGHELLTEMAQLNGAHHVASIDPKTMQPTIYIITRAEFEKQTIIDDPNLLTYKAGGSIIKSLSIKVDLSSLIGNITQSITDSGEQTSSGANDPGKNIAITANATLADAQPPSGDAPANINSTIGQGDSSFIPSQNTLDPNNNMSYLNDRAKTRALCQMKDIIQLEFSTLGYPLLRPGVVPFGGLGKRYSGNYTIFTVTHTIDSNGYNCKGQAYNHAYYDSSQMTPTDPTYQQGTPAAYDIDITKQLSPPDAASQWFSSTL